MKTSLYTFDDISLKIIVIIIICGLIGGVGNSLRGTRCDVIIVTKNIFLGIIAATTVPLFLNLVSSDIVKNLYEKKEADYLINYFIFSGFCIIAAFSSLNFLNTISGRVLQNLKEEIKELKSDNELLKETNKRLDNNITALAPITGETNPAAALEIEKFKKPPFVEIINSIKNEDNKFKPLDAVKTEVSLDNREIEKKIEMLKENHLIREIVSGEGEKAVALTDAAEQILK